MSKHFLPVIAIACALPAVAQEPADTLSTQTLDEVVVEAQMQKTSAGVSTYYPDSKSKRAAQNALELLNAMAIPQISINPISGTVTTPSGDNVAIYIDMEPATQEEKDGLRAEDVKKVEYLIFPTDPRFNHEKYVINITLRHYEYGGYTKLSGTANILAGSGVGSAYAKVAYRRMTYDINVTDKYTDRHHTGSELTQIYRLPQADGSIEEITRSNLLDFSRMQTNYLGASFRAKYTSDNITLSNRFFLSSTTTPRSISNGRLVFSPEITSGDFYSNNSHSTDINPGWQGNYFFDLGNDVKLNVIPSAVYQHTESRRLYSSAETSIETNARENAITGQLQFQINKTFHKYHTVDINLLGIYYYDKVDYTGNTIASPEFNQYAYGGILSYTFAKDNIYGQFMGAFAGEANKISGIRSNSFFPIFDLNIQYSLNDKNSLSLNAEYNINTASAADKTPDIIQENELLYKTGNPHLKNSYWSRVYTQYTFLPDNRYSLSAFAGWSRFFDRPVPVFTPDAPGGLMLRSIENNGYYQYFYIGASLTARLFERSLVLQARPNMWFEKSAGIYNEHSNYFALSLSATYYLDKFYLTAYYSPAWRGLNQYNLNATSSKGKCYYMLKAGWSNGKWNVSAGAINIFRKNWVASRSSLTSQWFDQFSTEYGADSHQFVSLTASYTFGFGKKVKHGDEVEAASDSNSAIMK